MAGEPGKESPLGAPLAGGQNRLRSYTPMQLHFLQRLAHLVKQRREHIHLLQPTDWKMRLINKALYSTYRDCVAEGVGEEAKQILERSQDAN
jgi:hypothetical protein